MFDFSFQSEKRALLYRCKKQLPVSWIENEFENRVIESPEVIGISGTCSDAVLGRLQPGGPLTLMLIALAMDAKKKQFDINMAKIPLFP